MDSKHILDQQQEYLEKVIKIVKRIENLVREVVDRRKSVILFEIQDMNITRDDENRNKYGEQYPAKAKS